MLLTRSTFARWALVLMLAGAIALISVVGISIWLSARSNSIAEEVTRVRAVRTLSSSTLEALLNAETGQRGFLLTESDEYLQPYETAVPQVRANLDRLRGLLSADAIKSQLLAEINTFANAKLSELARSVELERSGNRDGALAIVQTGEGKQLMDDARNRLRLLTAGAEARVASSMDQLRSDTQILIRTTILGGLLVILCTGGALWALASNNRDLLSSRQEIESLNVGLEARVAERTSALTRANEEIQRFAYVVSHDLRAPLVNIMGFTSELEAATATLRRYVSGPDDGVDRDAARIAATEDLPEAMRFIRASTAKMDMLINAILKLSREGQRLLRPEAIDLKILLDNSINSLKHQIDQAGAHVELPDKFPSVVSDRLALEQIVGNLIDNAIKYLNSDRPGKVVVETKQTADLVQLTISDNGRGIAAQDHERVFDLFRRAGRNDRPGEGVGLAHVRSLARRLGGEVTLRSQLGAGATFELSLPRVLRKELYRS